MHVDPRGTSRLQTRRERHDIERAAGIALILITLGLGLTGCHTPPVESARANFYVGRFSQANENLKDLPKDSKDELLYYMERGMIRQALRDYDNSAKDWRRAGGLNDNLETYSLSKGAASLIINDTVMAFRGAPFERTLVYAYLAKNYLALANWDYAAICARNIIKRQDNLDGYPDIAYARYMAGFCLEMIDDMGNASLQYQLAGKLAPNLAIDDDTGAITANTNTLAATVQVKPHGTNRQHSAHSRTNIIVEYGSTRQPSRANRTHAAPPTNYPCELVCFVSLGRSLFTDTTQGYGAMHLLNLAPYAEIYGPNNEYLGQSYPLANTYSLFMDTAKRDALANLAKEATRVAIKAAIAYQIDRQNEALGALAWLLLFAMEEQDTRHWETLPLWIEVARVPCPMELSRYTVIFKDAAGYTLGEKIVTTPITRRGHTYVSFCRDILQR